MVVIRKSYNVNKKIKAIVKKRSNIFIHTDFTVISTVEIFC